MPNVRTRVDSLREYLTGASSDGGVQGDPDLSLGGYRSATEAESMDISIVDSIPGLTVDYASGGNAVGVGSLYAYKSGSIQWKCANGSYGPVVAIANGETKIVETLGKAWAYVRVTRTSAAGLSGTASVTLSQAVNNLFGFDNVTGAQAASGLVEYRASIVVNESTAPVNNYWRYIGELATPRTSDLHSLDASGAGYLETLTVGAFDDWPDSGFCHIREVGGDTREIVYYYARTSTRLFVESNGREMLETTAAAGLSTDTIHSVPGIAIGVDPAAKTAGTAIQTIADEATPPVDVTWRTGITYDYGWPIGSLAPGEQIGLWIKRQIPPGCMSSTRVLSLIIDEFEAA